MDKVKAQTEQLQQKATQGMAQGQAKLTEMQVKKQSDALLRDLGAAFYAEQRTGGSREDVASALAALDGHAAANGAIDTRTTAVRQETGSAGTTAAAGAGGASSAGASPGMPTDAAPPTSSTPPSAPAGNYSLDDL